MPPTRATPIISADAVAAVRRGLRSAFSLASRPRIPASRGSGAEMTRTTGRASTGLRTVVPTKPASVPMSTSGSSPPTKPATSATALTAASRTPMPTRTFDGRVRSTATDRMTATGATFAARRAGSSADSRVTPTPRAKAMPSDDAFTTSGPSGQGDACAAPQRLDALGDPDTGQQAERRRQPADDQRLEGDAAPHLLGARADGPQQRELAGALGDQDHEGVVDDEGTDEQGHAGEDLHEDREEVGVLVVAVGVLRVERGAGDDVEAVGTCAEPGADRRRDLGLADAGGCLHGDAVDLAVATEEPLRGVEREEHCAVAGAVVRGAEPGDAHDRHVGRAGGGQHGGASRPVQGRPRRRGSCPRRPRRQRAGRGRWSARRGSARRRRSRPCRPARRPC